MMRDLAIKKAVEGFDGGTFRTTLARRVSMVTESQRPDALAASTAYLCEVADEFKAMGFACQLLSDLVAKSPFLFAERIEGEDLLTVFGYGHGDVTHGQEGLWRDPVLPWTLVEEDGNWYGRGVADNKGQHSINMAALRAVLETRGRLGFNAKYLIEMGEEIGSPGLRELCLAHRERFRADLFIASDGPRLRKDLPTIYLGSRGDLTFDMWVDARPTARHSGNWGGVISNPAIELANAIASVVGPTGQIRIGDWVPSQLPPSVRRMLSDLEIGDDGDDGVEAWWGEPGLRPIERLYGWSSFEILAFTCGNPEAPVNAIPPKAWARCQLRFVPGVEEGRILPALRDHLDQSGFRRVQIAAIDEAVFPASRLDPESLWVERVSKSLEVTTGKKTAILPNFGGSLPNAIFSDVLNLPTIWIPHSYSACSQHAIDEHLPKALIREALALMAGVYFDLGASD